MGISYLAVDAYYFKEKFVSLVAATGLQVVGKLRRDAELLWLALHWTYSGHGRPEVYDGKSWTLIIDSVTTELLLHESVRSVTTRCITTVLADSHLI